jgi:hypothetical protein
VIDLNDSPTVGEVLRGFIRDPVRHFIRHWNWKSATLSSVCRAFLFFLVNLPAGLDAGLRAMAVEMVFRACASGIFGSATQAFRHAQPMVTATLTALILIPAAGHLAEYAVHRLAGTARLGESIAVSVSFSVLTTAFNLFAMRRGVLVVGDQQQTFLSDLRSLPRTLLAFAMAGIQMMAVALRVTSSGRNPW